MKLLAVISFLGILIFSKPLSSQLERPLYLAPPQWIHHFSFGFSEVYADLLWLRLIQDMDFCNSKQGQPVYDGQTRYQCTKGWSYQMTETITELAPRFLKPYEVGASIMSVIMGDQQGAKKIYDKGVRRFPQNWRLHFGAGYHYLVELKDHKKAAPLLLHAARHGGPPWLYALAAQQYGEMGEALLSKKILEDFLKRNPRSDYKKMLEKRLEKIHKKLQLQ